MAEKQASKKVLPAIIVAVCCVVAGGYAFVKYAPAQWHWRLYAYQAAGAGEGKLEPPASYTGEWNNWDNGGRLLSRYAYRNGKRHGPYTVFSETGEIISEGQYADGELDGLQKIYHEGVRTEIVYANGKREGIEKTWYPSGQLMVETPWVNGVMEGSATFYYENGSIQATVPYYNNKIEGVQKSWHENGAPQGEETYSDNLLNGRSVFREPDGAVSMEFNYRNGTLDGVQVWNHPDGTKAREITMLQGMPNGLWREWDERGNLIRDERYEMGELKKPEGETPDAPETPAE